MILEQVNLRMKNMSSEWEYRSEYSKDNRMDIDDKIGLEPEPD